MNANSVESLDVDLITMTVELNSHRAVGLEAVFVGETYKKPIGHKKVLSDCGKLQIERTGVMEQAELGYVHIACNSSFVDQTTNSIVP